MAERRGRGEGSIYQRKDRRWVGAVDLGWVGKRRVRKTVTAATKRELMPKLRALRDEVEKGILPTNATVQQWMEHWLTDVAPRTVRASTLAGYESKARVWIIPQLGRRKLTALRPEHITAMTDTMAEAGKSTATQRQTVLVLQSALSDAVRNRRLSWNPAEVAAKPPVGKGSHGVLTRDETVLLLDLLGEYGRDGVWWVASRYLTALLGGLRQGEALGLTWDAVELEPGREAMIVRQTIQRQKGKGLVVESTKTEKPRIVPVVGPLAEALRQHRETAPDGYVWGGSKPVDPRADYGVWQGLLWSAGIPRRPLHAARATTASILGEARVPLRTIADILGHSQITTAWEHYVHTDDRQQRAALDEGLRMLGA